MSAAAPAPAPDPDSDIAPDPDPRPLPPKEPQLEDCCGSGCVNCVFDLYEISLEQYAPALQAWQKRHPGA